jgi:hypothetical protein
MITPLIRLTRITDLREDDIQPKNPNDQGDWIPCRKVKAPARGRSVREPVRSEVKKTSAEGVRTVELDPFEEEARSFRAYVLPPFFKKTSQQPADQSLSPDSPQDM